MRTNDVISVPRLLIVDSDPAICYTLQHILEYYGYSVRIATERMLAHTLLIRESFDLLLIAARAPGSGPDCELLHSAMDLQPGAALVLLRDTPALVLADEQTAVYAYTAINKHAGPTLIASSVAQALAEHAMPLAMLQLGV